MGKCLWKPISTTEYKMKKGHFDFLSHKEMFDNLTNHNIESSILSDKQTSGFKLEKWCDIFP